MTGHIPMPEMGVYGLAIAIVFCLAVHSLTTHLRDNWLTRWKNLDYWYAHILSMVMVSVGACFVFEPLALFQTSPWKAVVSIPVGLILGWVTIRIDRTIVRNYVRRGLRGGARKTVGQHRSRMQQQQGWNVRPVGSERSTAASPAWTGTGTASKPLSALWVLMAIAALEELIFRGFLVQACQLIASPIWIGLAILGTVIVFALVHVQFGWVQVFGKLPLGVLTMASVLWLDTLIPAILIHTIFNWSVWRDTEGDLRVLFRSTFA